MATPRPKSPGPRGPTKKDDKEESFWEKIGTLGRKKRIKEGLYNAVYLRDGWGYLNMSLYGMAG